MSKRIFTSVLIIVVISFGFGCRSKTVVKKLVNQNANISNKSETKKIDGVMYHLPKTMVQVTVPVNKVSKSPGEFAEFAPCFFSASEREGMITKPSQSFSVGQPSFSAHGIPDTSETYVISTKGKYFESKSLFVEYSPGYVLTKGEAESKNETLEFTAKAIATAAGIASKASVLFSSTDPSTEDAKKALLESLSEEYNCYKKIEASGLVTGAKLTELQTVSAILNLKLKKTLGIGFIGGEQAILDAYESNDNQLILLKNPEDFRNRYEMAKVLFEKLKSLNSQRDGALSDGGKAIPPETYKQYLERTSEAVAAHRAAFLGLASKETWAATLEFEPDKDTNNYATNPAYVYSDNSKLLFTYSKTSGVCNNGELREKSLPINLAFRFAAPNDEVCNNTLETNIQALWLNVVKSDSQTYLNDVKAANENAAQTDKSRGWFYRVPANGVITLQTQEFTCQSKGTGLKNSCLINSLTFGGTITADYDSIGAPISGIPINSTQFARNEMLVAQLGVVASVPASTAGRSSVTAILLDPTTGAMKNYKSSSLPLVDKAILDDAQKAANSTIDAVDPLNRKKRELEELKIQNDINEAKKKLVNTNMGNN